MDSNTLSVGLENFFAAQTDRDHLWELPECKILLNRWITWCNRRLIVINRNTLAVDSWEMKRTPTNDQIEFFRVDTSAEWGKYRQSDILWILEKYAECPAVGQTEEVLIAPLLERIGVLDLRGRVLQEEAIISHNQRIVIHFWDDRERMRQIAVKVMIVDLKWDDLPSMLIRGKSWLYAVKFDERGIGYEILNCDVDATTEGCAVAFPTALQQLALAVRFKNAF